MKLKSTKSLYTNFVQVAGVFSQFKGRLKSFSWKENGLKMDKYRNKNGR